MFLQLESILESEFTFPTLEVLHILGFAIGVGTIALVDFRLLGRALPDQKASDLSSDVMLWTTFGIGLVILSGTGLFISDPDLYYLNPSFQMKMTVLVIALIFHYTVHQRKVNSDAPAASVRWVAILSLLLWAIVIFGGIFIAFTGEAA